MNPQFPKVPEMMPLSPLLLTALPIPAAVQGCLICPFHFCRHYVHFDYLFIFFNWEFSSFFVSLGNGFSCTLFRALGEEVTQPFPCSDLHCHPLLALLRFSLEHLQLHSAHSAGACLPPHPTFWWGRTLWGGG